MKRRILIGVTLFICFFMLSARAAISQDVCEGDFDNDGDCDGIDATMFKADFGRSRLNNECPPYSSVPVVKTGQITCYDGDGLVIPCDGSGQDGEYQKGVSWPVPRFTDNLDGTITDNLTSLIWLKDADCLSTRIWIDALSFCNGLADGECGLTDGSNVGDWRLPNRKELFSLVHDGIYSPAIPDTMGTGQWSPYKPFINVRSSYYWTSNTVSSNTIYAWSVHMGAGLVGDDVKSRYFYVWPVRGGH